MPRTLRCLNIVNFIRENEPRFSMDMMEPVIEQMKILKALGLPATWPLQYDALVRGPFCSFLKAEMPANHEPALWLEMNEPLCRDAGVEWRGRPGFSWDHLPSVAYTLGYTPEERLKLADQAVAGFREVWGFSPATVSCWNLDALTMAHLAENHGVLAFAVCRDQITTDGYTIWGAPFAGWLPSRTCAWSPALSPEDQIPSPVLRMLGQDPVSCYDDHFTLADGRVLREPNTMEPAWQCGKMEGYIEAFLEMFARGPSLQFAYLQLGQENTFPWPDQVPGYEVQMRKAAALKAQGEVHVEVMSETARRFREAFSETPVQAQVQLRDPFNRSSPEGSVWFGSRWHRTNLHFSQGTAWFRDITLYREGHVQPFLWEPARADQVEQRMLAALDAFHWRPKGHEPEDQSAGGYLLLEGELLASPQTPTVTEAGESLVVALTGSSGEEILVRMEPERLILRCLDRRRILALELRWDPSLTAFTRVLGREIHYLWEGSPYAMTVVKGTPREAGSGVLIQGEEGEIILLLSPNRGS